MGSNKTAKDNTVGIDNGRRHFFRASATAIGASALGIVPDPLRSAVWAQGSDAPELTELRVGFMPLTDCAPIIIAAEMGFDRQHGIKIIPSKEPSWAAIRDKTLSGELHAAHLLYGMVYGVETGIGGQQQDMAVLMTLNQNGQGITLSRQLQKQGVTDGTSLKQLVSRKERRLTFAQTFPTGTHALWLYYWLAAHDIHPLQDIRTIVVPPPQMAANMRLGSMDGYCAGEPWNARAVADGTGFSVATSQDIWADHPEKVLGATAHFVKQYPNTTRALLMAILEACRFIDQPQNHARVASIIADKRYINIDASLIEGRFMGLYDNGLGRRWQDAHPMRFFADGEVNFPYLSDGMWFLTQQKRWGMLTGEPDYLAISRKVNQIALYREAASQVGVAIPATDMRSSRLMDGSLWDGSTPSQYAASFDIQAS